MIGAWPFLDYWRWAAGVDFIADDNYPIRATRTRTQAPPSPAT